LSEESWLLLLHIESPPLEQIVTPLNVVKDIFLGFRVALLIGDIPPERLEERIEKLPAQLGFVVTLALVGLAVLLEPVDESGNDRGRLTHSRQSLCVSVSVPPQNTPFPAGNHPALLARHTRLAVYYSDLMDRQLNAPTAAPAVSASQSSQLDSRKGTKN
jgi:hypothetical protein